MHIHLYVVLTNFVVSVVMFFRFVTAGDIRTRADFFEPFITGLSNTTVDQVCIHAYYVLEFKPIGDIIKKTSMPLCEISVNFKVFLQQ